MRVAIKLLLAVLVVSCTSGSKKSQHPALGCWDYKEISSQGEQVKIVSAGDKFCLQEDSTFYYFLSKEMIYASGKWNIADSVIALSYDFIPSGEGVDSVIVSDAGLISYYMNGRVIKRMGLARSLTKGKSYREIYLDNRENSLQIRSYNIDSVSANQFVFSENGVNFIFTKSNL